MSFLLGQPLVIGGQPQVTRIFHLLQRMNDVVYLTVALHCPGFDIFGDFLVILKAIDVGLVHIPFGVSVGHPLRNGFTGPARVRDPNSNCCPETGHMGRPHNWIAVDGENKHAVDFGHIFPAT